MPLWLPWRKGSMQQYWQKQQVLFVTGNMGGGEMKVKNVYMNFGKDIWMRKLASEFPSENSSWLPLDTHLGTSFIKHSRIYFWENVHRIVLLTSNSYFYPNWLLCRQHRQSTALLTSSALAQCSLPFRQQNVEIRSLGVKFWSLGWGFYYSSPHHHHPPTQGCLLSWQRGLGTLEMLLLQLELLCGERASERERRDFILQKLSISLIIL